MLKLAVRLLLSSLLCGSVACHGDDKDPAEASTGSAALAVPIVRPHLVDQVPPPLDLKAPPASATKTESGLVYERVVANEIGPRPKPNETALVWYTGWRQRSGQTFFTTKGRVRPIAIDIAHAAPGFAEALQLLHKGEKAVLWMPPGQSTVEPIVYEIELVDILSPAPAAKGRAHDGEQARHAP